MVAVRQTVNLLTVITSRHDYTYIQLAKEGNHCTEFDFNAYTNNLPLLIILKCSYL